MSGPHDGHENKLSSNVMKLKLKNSVVRVAFFLFCYFANCYICICNGGSEQMCAIKEVRVVSDDQTSKQLKPVFFHPAVYKFLAESR